MVMKKYLKKFESESLLDFISFEGFRQANPKFNVVFGFNVYEVSKISKILPFSNNNLEIWL